MENESTALFTPEFPPRFFLERCNGVLRRPASTGGRVAVLATEVLNGGWTPDGRVEFEPDMECLRGLPAPDARFVFCNSAAAAALCMLLGPPPRHTLLLRPDAAGWSVRMAVSGKTAVPLSVVPPT